MATRRKAEIEVAPDAVPDEFNAEEVEPESDGPTFSELAEEKLHAAMVDRKDYPAGLFAQAHVLAILAVAKAIEDLAAKWTDPE